MTHGIGRVKLAQAKQKFKHDSGTIFSPADIELANAVLADGGEHAFQDLLNEVPKKGQIMSISSEGLRKALMEEFATPQFPSDAARRVAGNTDAAFGNAYYAFQQLAKANLLVQADRAQHPATGRMLFRYVDPTTQVQPPTKTAKCSRATPSTTRGTNPKLTEPKASAQPTTSTPQSLENGHANFVEICSTAAHFLLDVALGVRELSEKDLTAMRYLSRMLHEKVEEYSPDEDESAVSEREDNTAQQGRPAA